MVAFSEYSNHSQWELTTFDQINDEIRNWFLVQPTHCCLAQYWQKHSIKRKFSEKLCEIYRKILCRSLFLLNLQACSVHLIKKSLRNRCFPVNFTKFDIDMAKWYFL